MTLRIDGDTRLSQVLEAVPGALDYIVGLNPHDFERLRNPTMRKYMSSRISLHRVAVMARTPEQQLLGELRRLNGGVEAESEHVADEALPMSTAVAPAWLEAVDRQALHWVNVLPVDDVFGDPFPVISLAVRQLPTGAVLGIRHRWEPQPLYDVWSKMALEWHAERIAEDEWHVFVHRPPEASRLPIKPVVGSEVGQLAEAEIAPRLIALAEQLESAQALEVGGLDVRRLERVRAAVQTALGPDYGWTEQSSDADRLRVRITRHSQNQ